MSDFLLGLIGQNAEQQARNDIGDYDPKTGKIERDEIEQFFDNFFGRSGKIQEEGQSQYIDSLEGSRVGDALLTLRPDATIGANTTMRDLRRDLSTATEQDTLISDITATGLATRSKTELQDLDVGALTSLRTELQNRQRTNRDKEPGGKQWTAQRQLDLDEKADKRYYHQQEESNKRYASEAEYRRWSAEKDDAWRKYQAGRDDARLSADRQERGLQREQNLQLAVMDREDKKADRQMAREDRLASQRQASIMALVKGLTQMGAGFAI